MRTSLTAILFCTVISGCAANNYDFLLPYGAPSETEVAAQFSCTPESLAAGKKLGRYAIPQSGQEFCEVFGMYGAPNDITTQSLPTGEGATVSFRAPGAKTVHVHGTKYTNPTVAQYLHKPMGKWLVDTVVTTTD